MHFLKICSPQAGGSYTLNNKLLQKAEKHIVLVSDSTIERLQKKRKCSEAIDASTQNSTHDLCTVTLPLYFRFEEQHAKRKMRRVKKGANYRLTAGWPETNLIIIIVKNAQRKPAASPLPPQSNREAFSLRNDLQSDKSNRFTVTA